MKRIVRATCRPLTKPDALWERPNLNQKTVLCAKLPLGRFKIFPSAAWVSADPRFPNIITLPLTSPLSAITPSHRKKKCTRSLTPVASSRSTWRASWRRRRNRRTLQVLSCSGYLCALESYLRLSRDAAACTQIISLLKEVAQEWLPVRTWRRPSRTTPAWQVEQLSQLICSRQARANLTQCRNQSRDNPTRTKRWWKNPKSRNP